MRTLWSTLVLGALSLWLSPLSKAGEKEIGGSTNSDSVRVQKLVSGRFAGAFQESLFARENAEFILEPALLVREALSQKATSSLKKPIQFDGVVQLFTPAIHTHVTLFIRYSVSVDSYALNVIWAEPHGRGLNFPIYPPSLRLQSRTNSFEVSHDLYTNQNGTFPKPFGPETVFTNMIGDYTLANIRFAEQRHSQARSNLIAEGKEKLLESACEIPAQLPGAAKIKFNGKSYEVRDASVVDYDGGREWTFSHASISFQEERLSLPARIIVKKGNGELSRRIFR